MENTPKRTTFTKKLLPLAGFILLCSLPEIIIWLTQPAGKTFVGTVVNIDDLNVYLSAVRQGAEGKWLFTPQYSPEKIPAHLALLPYILIGKAQRLFDGPTIIYFQILKLAAFLFAGWSLLKLIRTSFPGSIRLQSKAFYYVLFSSGLGWLFLIITGSPSRLTPDLTTPEWNLVTSFLSAPHFLLGIGFQALVILAIHDLGNTPEISHVIRLFIFGAGLGLTYPFLIPVNGLILAFWLIANSIRRRKVPWKLLLSSGTGSIPMILLLAYYGLNPPQNPQIPPPSPVGIIYGFGFLLIFALIGIPHWLKSEDLIIHPIWILSILVALYLPFDFSGRFILGLFIPLSLMAAYGLENIILPKFQQVKAFQKEEGFNPSRIFFLLMIPSNIVVLIFAFNAAQTIKDYPYYYEETEKQALIWLAEKTTEEDLLLAGYPISSLTPRYASTRTFLGHLYLTIDLEEKRDLLLEFWDKETTNARREEFLKQWEVTYIYQGRFEKAISGSKIIPPGEIIYQKDDITIYAAPP